VDDGGFEANSPARFTKILSVSLINLSKQAIFVKMIAPTARTLKFEPDQSAPVLLFPELKNIAPLSRAYDFFITRNRSTLKKSILALRTAAYRRK
jgi:hypothetical protein